MIAQVDVAVVGAGPGGMEAALAAVHAGARVTLIDGYSRPGGQYFKQLPGPFGSEDTTQHQAQAEATFRQLATAGVPPMTDTVVWDAFPASDGGWRLALYGPNAPLYLQTQALILATGAYDRPVAFPGWTLPGVMTAGAAQTLLKHQRVTPGRRVLLSGTGPLQLAVAAQLVQVGVEVVGVFEGAHLGLSAARHAPAMWGQWTRVREGWQYWSTLQRAGVPLRPGWSVVEARGDGDLQEVAIARLDDVWRPVPGSREIVAADTLLIGYGFVPSTELSRLLGCRLEFMPQYGGHVPWRDERMQTSLAGVYAAGDGAGIGGAGLSRVEGRIAGLAAARQVGRLSAEAATAAIARLQPALARERRFARMLGELFTPGPGLDTLAKDDTVICRCEEVRKEQIVKAIAAGCESVTWVKRMTRAGMGMCQGRICGCLVSRLIADQTNQDPARILPDTVRPPVKPIPLSILEERDGQ